MGIGTGRTIVFLFIAALGASALADEAPPPRERGCPRWAENPANLPLCPDNGLLSSEFPALAHVISENDRNTALEKENEQHRIVDFVKKILVYSGSHTPLIFLNLSEATWEKVRGAIDGIDVPADRKQAFRSALRWIRPEAASPHTWMQDEMETFVNPLTGALSVRAVQNYRESGGASSRIAEMARECPLIQAGPPLRGYPNESQNSESGGNIEFAPFGICLTGTTQNPAYSRQFCHARDEVKFPTDFLTVGHVDEVASVHLFRQPSCKVLVAVASYAKARTLLESRADQTVFDFFRPADLPAKQRREWLTETFERKRPFRDFCEWFAKQESATYDVANSLPVPPELSVASDHLSPSGPTRRERRRVPCEHALVRDFLRYVNDESNRGIDQKLAASTESLIAKLRERAPQGCAVEKVEMPQVMSGTLSFFPNPSNLVRSGDTLLIPDPQSEMLRGDLHASFQAHHVSVSFADSIDLHMREGNLHCASNTIRICRPNPQAKFEPIPIDTGSANSLPSALSLDEVDTIQALAASDVPATRVAIVSRVRDLYASAPAPKPTAAVDALIARLRGETERAVVSEVLRLHDTRHPRDLGLLRAYLASPNAATRAAAANSAFWLMKEGDPASEAMVREMLRHRDPQVVVGGLFCARNIKLPGHDPAAYIGSDQVEIRRTAVQCAAENGTANPARLALASSLDPDAKVRENGLSLVSVLTPARAQALIDGALQDTDADVRTTAALTGYREFPDRYRAAYVQALLKSSRSENIMNRLFTTREDRIPAHQLTTIDAVFTAADATELERLTETMGHGNSHAGEIYDALSGANRRRLVARWTPQKNRNFLAHALEDSDPLVWQPAARKLIAQRDKIFYPSELRDRLAQRERELKP